MSLKSIHFSPSPLFPSNSRPPSSLSKNSNSINMTLYDLAPTQFTNPVRCHPPQSPWPSFLLALHFLFPLSRTSTASPILTPNPTKGIFTQRAPSHLTADNPSLGRVPQSLLPLLVPIYHTTLPSYYSL